MKKFKRLIYNVDTKQKEVDEVKGWDLNEICFVYKNDVNEKYCVVDKLTGLSLGYYDKLKIAKLNCDELIIRRENLIARYPERYNEFINEFNEYCKNMI